MMVRLACFDSAYRTDEVYDFCKEWRDVARPIKGWDKLSGAPYRVSKIDRNANTGKLLKRNVQLWHLDTNYFKSKISRLVSITPGENPKWHLHRDPSDVYLKQFCGEHKIIDRNRKTGKPTEIWQKKKPSTRVDFWDAEVYATAAADMLHVSALRPDGQIQDAQPRERKSSSLRRGGRWNKRGGGWNK